jgi:hypothetical protein
MKRLEDAVIPTVGSMASDLSVPLDIPQQWTIAQWAIKTAMVWEYVSKHNVIFYSDDERAGLRLAGTIPPHTAIWLARTAGNETFFTKGNTAVSDGLPKMDAYVTTIAYKYFVVQIMTVRPYQVANPFFILDGNKRMWPGAFVPIWPTVACAEWPPPMSVAPRSLDDFHARYRSRSTDKG